MEITKEITCSIPNAEVIREADPQFRRVSKTQVIIEVDNKEQYSVLTAPSGYVLDDIIDHILHYFTLNHYVHHISIKTKSARNTAARSFFEFLEILNKSRNQQHGKKYNKQVKIDPIFITRWFEHMKKHETPSMLWNNMIVLSSSLRISVDNVYGGVSNYPVSTRQFIRELENQTPKRPLSKKRVPLGMYLGISESEYSNKELLLGMRYGALWLLGILESKRKIFLADQEIKHSISNLDNLDSNNFKDHFTGYKEWISQPTKTNPTKQQLFSTISKPLWQIIRNDQLLSEWQFYSYKQTNPILTNDNPRNTTPFSAEHINTFINRSINNDGAARSHIRSNKAKQSEINAWAIFLPYFGTPAKINTVSPCFYGADWIIHTTLERVLMEWLLASERVQSSGISSLRLDEIAISQNGSSLQLTSTKNRRAAKSIRVTSDSNSVKSNIYKRNSAVYKTYLTWKLRAESAIEISTGYNANKLVLPNTHQTQLGTIPTSNNSCFTYSFLPLALLCKNGTTWNKEFLKDSNNETNVYANAFITIMRNRLEHAALQDRCAIPIEVIGQSLVVEQQLESNILDNITSLTSDTLGHSPETGEAYKNGFLKIGVKEIVEPVRSFARSLGDEKMQIAENIINRMKSSTTRVTLEELQTICGITESKQVQIDILSNLDEADKLTITGAIDHDGKKLIVETDMTAGLMWGYIKHLENEITKLMESEREGTCIEALATLIHLHQIFNSFSLKIQNKGKKIASDLCFPYPPIT